ncbi:glutamate-rich protein 3 isoform X2 [Pan troglodytes]|uniref:glutamate-rich protein 3 isoform X2 n=1 Tax=Pan troglodytes TaxID=9598 RepID=UPI0007DBCA60|nr:glutamate-rich protein 3 isoform X2 [Pan troglodytes]
MSHSHPAGLLAAYNSLMDKHLAGYFNNTRIRRHLLRSGLITRSGRILSEKEYKLNIMKRDHQKYIRECLAQAIFHKVLDMERYHHLEIKKKLETLARKERIQRFKGEHTRRSVENNMPILSPHPPVGPKTNRGHSVLVDEGHSSPLALTAPRPYTAPGNMQPPIRLQPLPSNPAVETVPKLTSRSRSKTSLLENEALFPIGGKKAVMKFRNSIGNSQRMNSYQLPNINSYMMPIPPPLPPNGKITRENRSETWRRRRFRPTTAPNGLEPLLTKDSRRIHKTSLHSNAAITMIYLGKNVHLSSDNPDFRDEIKVYQQHCGGENLCVYKGKLLEKEYEEDFEVDEEKQGEKANEEGQADVQMNGIPQSPLDDKKDNLDPEKESETSSQKAPDAHDNVKDENDGYSESELEEDKQDMKTASSTSSRSHPYSSDSEDESAVGDREAHTDSSTDESARRSSSQELSENDKPRKSHLPIEESLEIEIEDQEITKADVETKPMPIEESFENVLKEGTEKGTQEIAEGLSEKSGKHVSAEEKEKDKSKLWEESTAQVKDKKAGLPGVEEGGKDSLPLAYVLALGAPTMNFVVDETAAINSNKESQQLAQKTHTLEKKEAMEEDEAPQHRDADIVQGKGEAALWGEAGAVHEAPLRAWKPTAEQPELAEEFTEKREIPPGIERGAEGAAEAEGVRRLGEGGSDPIGQAAAKDAVGLSKDEAPEKQALMLTVLETDKAASEGEQGLEKAVLANKAAALNLEHLHEVAALREAATSEEGEAEGGVAVSDVGESEEEASIDLEDTGPMEDTASKREDGSEEAIIGGEEPAKERKEVMRTETRLSPFTGEAEASRMQVSEGSPEEGSLAKEAFLCKEDVEGEEMVTEAEANREDDRKEILPKELDVARQRRKAERPKTSLRKTDSEREEVTRANALKDEDAFKEEQKLKAEEGKTETEVRSEEETKAPPNEMGSDAENEARVEASELSDNPGLLGEDSLKETVVPIFEATPGFEKWLENITALRKEGGGERLSEARDTEHKDREELSSRENRALKEGHRQDGEGALAAPEAEPAGKVQAPEGLIPATGQAEELAAKDHDSCAGLEGRAEGQGGVDVVLRTQEAVPEEDPIMAEKFREEAVDEDPEEEEDKECTLETEAMQDRNSEGDGDMEGEGNTQKNEGMGGGRVVAVEVLHGGGETAETAAEEREVLAGSETAEEKTIANKASSFSDVAEEETWHQQDELVGKTAAAGKVVVEELARSGEEVPAAEEMTVTCTTEAGVGTPGALEGKTSGLGQEQEGGSEGQEAATGSGDGRQESGAAEKFRLRLSRVGERELSPESLQAMATLPVKPDFTESREKQQHMVQGESETADVSPNNMQV